MRRVNTPGSRFRLAVFALPLALGVGACEPSSDDLRDPPVDPPPLDDPTEEMFEPDHLLRIEIDMADEDWDFVRTQTRSLAVLAGQDCLAEPFGSPFSYVEATVTIDGEVIESVGVRKKGFLGSLHDQKPSLKIKFDEYVDQRFSGLQRMTLNNNRQDAGYIRQCIGYQLFANAGVPAPRCNFARVTVNGRELGIYAHVEPVKKRFLARHFEDNEGRLYEGTLSDYRDGWSGTFEAKTNKTDPDRSDIEAMIASLTASDSRLLDELETLIDVDRFLTFWVMEVLINHVDGYANNTNNFFVYTDPTTGLIEFLPWGIDNILSGGNDFPDGDNPPLSVFATGMLPRRLYTLPQTRDRYVDRMQELLDTVWDEDEILDEIDRMEALIEPFVGRDLFLGARNLGDEIDQIRDFVTNRRSEIEPELTSPPAWNFPLRDSFCFIEIGDVQATFDTTFGTLGEPDVFASGTGTLTGNLEDATLSASAIGTRSGIDPDNPTNALVQLIAQTSPTKLLVIVASTSSDNFTSGASLSLDLGANIGYAIEFDVPTGESRVLGLFLGGTLDLDQASLSPGAAVSGSFGGSIVQLPF